MGKISLIIPQATENFVINPSFSKGVISDFWPNWWLHGGLDPASFNVVPGGVFGTHCGHIAPSGADEGVWQNTEPYIIMHTTNTLSYYVKVVSGRMKDCVYEAPNWVCGNPTPISWTGDGLWHRVIRTVPPGVDGYCTDPSFESYGGPAEFYIDGVQFEPHDYATTFCDGSQPGCFWKLGKHLLSNRSEFAREGGIEVELDTYDVSVGVYSGVGMPPVQHIVQTLGSDYRANLQQIKPQARVITLSCFTPTRSEEDKFTARKQLIDALKPLMMRKNSPIMLKFTVGDKVVTSPVYYDSGLEANFVNICSDRFVLRLISYDPFWRDEFDTPVEILTEDHVDCKYFLGRRDGEWGGFGVSSVTDPGAGIQVHTITRDPHSDCIYVGGDFLDWNGNIASDYFVGLSYIRESPYFSEWDSMVPWAFNNVVHIVYVASDGKVYIGGEFTNAGGDADADYLCEYSRIWPPSVTAVAGGGTGKVRTITQGLDGKLYFGGDFVNWNADADADRLATWDGSTYGNIGAANGPVRSMATHPNGDIYVGGDFSNIGGVTLRYIARWDGTDWHTVGEGLEGAVYSIDIAQDGTVYVGGAFDDVYGSLDQALMKIAKWDGSNWQPLGSGLNDEVRVVKVADDGTVYVGGMFKGVEGSLYLLDRVAKWSGAVWTHLDVDLPNNSTVEAIEVGPSETMVPEKHDVYFGFNQEGESTHSYKNVITYSGTAPANPTFWFANWLEDTTANLRSVRNYSTGAECLFNLDMLPGERVTLTMGPEKYAIESDFRGDITNEALPNSDFTNFTLQPGENIIETFILPAGAPTVSGVCSGVMFWKNTHWSVDGIA